MAVMHKRKQEAIALITVLMILAYQLVIAVTIAATMTGRFLVSTGEALH